MRRIGLLARGDRAPSPPPRPRGGEPRRDRVPFLPRAGRAVGGRRPPHSARRPRLRPRASCRAREAHPEHDAGSPRRARIPAMSAPASAAASTSSARVRPQTFTSGRERSSASFAAGSRARMSAEPTRIASAPASSAAAPCARDSIPLSATTIRSRGAEATSVELRTAVDRERREVARVDPDDRCVEAPRASELLRRRAPRRACRGRGRRAAPSSRRVVSSSRSRRMRSAASAPASRALRRSSSVEKNPFASSGRCAAARAARRSSQEPPKRASTRIETAAAPACS